MRYHNVGLPYRLSIISLSFPHSCATGGFPLANDTCMCRYTLPRRWHWIFGGAARGGIQKQSSAVGGEGEGGAGEDVRGCGGDAGGVSGYVYRKRRECKKERNEMELKGAGWGMCTDNGGLLWRRESLFRLTKTTIYPFRTWLLFFVAEIESVIYLLPNSVFHCLLVAPVLYPLITSCLTLFPSLTSFFHLLFQCFLFVPISSFAVSLSPPICISAQYPNIISLQPPQSQKKNHCKTHLPTIVVPHLLAPQYINFYNLSILILLPYIIHSI